MYIISIRYLTMGCFEENLMDGINYFEYLNKKLSMPENAKASERLVYEEENKKEVDTDMPSVKINNESIFTQATKTDIEKIDYEKILMKQEDLTEDTKFSALEYIIREFFSFEKIVKAADKNQDGEISKEEASQYIEKLSKLDGDGTNLTLEDFEKAIQAHEIDLEKLLEEYMSASEADVLSTQADTAAPVQTSPATQSFGRFTGTPAGNRIDYVPSTPVTKSINEMTIDELNDEKQKRTTDLNEKQNALNKVQKGETEGIRAAAKAQQEAKLAYEKALEKDEAAKPYIEQIKKNNEAIENNQKATDENKVDISNKENEISNQKHKLASSKNGLSALKEALSALPKKSGKAEDKERDAQIDAKKKTINTKIKEQEKTVKNQEAALKKLEKELKELNKQGEKLKKEEEKLQKDKEKLDKIINEKCTQDVKNKLKVFNNATIQMKEVKTQELKTAQENVKAAKESVAEVNTKILEVMKQNIKNENSISENLNIEGVPAKYRRCISEKTLPNGTKVLTFNYTNYQKLKPELQEQIKIFNQVANEKGYTFVISDGYRSIAESNAARARKGNMVAPGGKSPHNYGSAIDCGLYKNGKEVASRQEWEEFANEVKRRSNNKIKWGGNFKSKPYEVWHFETNDWKKYKVA